MIVALQSIKGVVKGHSLINQQVFVFPWQFHETTRAGRGPKQNLKGTLSVQYFFDGHYLKPIQME
jgi:hypothetical protein